MNVWQRRCQETWLAEARPSVVAWPWENHGWERAFCRTARRLNVRTLGYQHTVIGPHQLNYSPATNADGDASLPDTVVCNGPAYRDQLIDWGVAPGRMVIGGSLRIGRPAGNAYDPDGPVFVALSARRGIARQQMAAVEAAAGQGFSFLVKDHPMYPMDIPENDSIRRARGTVAEQPSLSAVFYSTGTSGLEALLAGLPTFRLLPEDEIAVDVLPDFASTVAVTAGELAGALGSAAEPRPLAWEDVLAPVDWALWRRLFSTGAETAAASDQAPDPAADRKEKTA
jgi:surface carbohydrate biosynthesis protein (TIGR04326 family)